MRSAVSSEIETTATFTVTPDLAREYLHITMAGSWKRETIEEFAAAVASTLGLMIRQGARPGHILTLCDMRNKNILPQDVTTEFPRLISPESPSRRIAILLSGALHRLQSRRIQHDPRVRICTNETDARLWLFGEASTGDRTITSSGV